MTTVSPIPVAPAAPVPPIRPQTTQTRPPMGPLTDPAFLARHGDVYAGALTFRNSDAGILRFPFPFAADSHRMYVNIEPHDRTGATGAFHAAFDIDEHYLAAVAERANTIARDPTRSQALPHMMEAQWEAMEFVMENMALDFPQQFSFSREGDRGLWINRPLGIERRFTFGDATTLPCDPLEYIARQMQGDIILLDQRGDTFFADAGVVTEASGWSFDFIVGADWMSIHGPVPGKAENSVIDRARRMTLSLAPGAPQRRVNWMLQMRPRMDVSMENRPVWMHDYDDRSAEHLPDTVVMRVEFQQLYRLPRSNAVVFVLRNYLATMRELCRVRKWAVRMHRVFRDFDPTLDRYATLPERPALVAWLSRFDDGRETSPGRGPDQSVLDAPAS